MNLWEAQRILLLYRPGTADGDDPEVAAALEQARRDPELQRWFAAHCASQEAMRKKFQKIPVPVHLKERILAERKIIRPSIWWHQPVWLATAAALLLLIGLAAWWMKPERPDRFANYRARMVSTALRVGTYKMSIVTNDMAQVRQYMASQGAVSDYSIPRGLGPLSLTGGDALRWRGNPVSMVCFDRGDQQMLYLFVLPRSALKDPPPAAPQLAKVNKLMTASWCEGDKAYVLAGPEEPDFGRRYL